MRNTFTLAFLTLAILLISVVSGPSLAFADDVSCGDTIIVDTKLHADLNCAALVEGLVIGADGITLDLDGHTISGIAGHNGVLVEGHSNVTVKNGLITGFIIGIRLRNSDNNHIQDMVTNDNLSSGIALLNGSDNNEVKNCTSSDNTFLGIQIANGSDGNLVEGCWLASNLEGIHINGSNNNIVQNTSNNNTDNGIIIGTSHNNIVMGNITNNNQSTGIRLHFDAMGNTIQDNVANDNDFAGIFVGTSDGNVIEDNTADGNGVGIYLSRGSDNNQVLDNTVTGSVRGGIRLHRNSDNNLVLDNRLIGNRDGIRLSRGADNNEIRNNQMLGNLRDGLRVSQFVNPTSDPVEVDPQDNLIVDNELSGNAELDLNDQTTGGDGTGGTKNTYLDNQCATSAPAGLC